MPAEPPGEPITDSTVSMKLVGWDEALQHNRANWDDRAELHEQSYGLEAFDDPSFRSHVSSEDMLRMAPHLPGGTLAGLRLAHLQCHIGSDTVSFARMGARVTGLDLSPRSFEVAARLAERAGTEATWVCSDVMRARDALDGEFDVVYTSVGAINWVADMAAWAKQAAGLLAPGGLLYVRDTHPMLNVMDDEREGLHIRYPYFDTGQALVCDDSSTYSGNGTVENSRNVEFMHSLADIIGGVLGAGLQLVAFDETRELDWHFLPQMQRTEHGTFMLPEAERDLVPCNFVLAAVKPA